MFIVNIPFMDFVVDINCDMGESFGTYRIGNDEEVIKYITSSNIACGFHASDPNVMKETVTLCKKHDVMVGAHPGYPDLLGFGRGFEEKSFLNIVTNLRKAFGDIRFLTLGTKKTGELKERCKKEGIRLVLEAFPDRMYTDVRRASPQRIQRSSFKKSRYYCKKGNQNGERKRCCGCKWPLD